MPTFNKSRGFKLKSGNTVSFKEIGSSPVQQQADATLVGAARAAAMANVPKDLSAQYNKTAEGVIAANKGKTEMLTTLAKEAPGILTAAGRGIGKVFGVEKDYKTSIADIREITGAASGEKKEEPNYKDIYNQQKYKGKLDNLNATKETNKLQLSSKGKMNVAETKAHKDSLDEGADSGAGAKHDPIVSNQEIKGLKLKTKVKKKKFGGSATDLGGTKKIKKTNGKGKANGDKNGNKNGDKKGNGGTSKKTDGGTSESGSTTSDK